MIWAALRAGGLIALIGVLVGPYAVLTVIGPRQRHRVAALFFAGCLKLTGIRLSVSGWAAPGTTLFAANHASYLDIVVLGSVLSHGVFVAKSEVARWPLFGFLARLAGSEFIARNPAEAQRQCHGLAKRLHAGDSLIVFPEGTSSDGTCVKPFKSTLFAALDLAPCAGRVQPVTLVYRNSACAWYGDMTLAPHLWQMFKSAGGLVEVVFHDPVFRADFPDRKQLAKYCEVVIRDGLDAALFVSSQALPLAAE